MPIPKLYTTDELAEALGRSVASLERDRAAGTGCNFIRLSENGAVRYLETDVIEWLNGLRQLPDPSGSATPAQMRTAVRESFAGVAAGARQRMTELAAADKPVEEPDPYAVTVGVVGSTPGESIQRIINIPPTDVIAQPAPHILSSR